MLGYRSVLGDVWYDGYAGVDYETHDNPVPTARVRGGKWGFRGLLEAGFPLTDDLQLSGLASYSTPFQTFFGILRGGLRTDSGLTLGPEGSYFNNVSDHEFRAGAFVAIPFRAFSLDVSGGTTFAAAHSNGYYVGVNIGLNVQ